MSENIKRKIIYYVVTIIGLALLAVMVWNSPISKGMIQESILLMSALLAHSGEIITSPFFIGIVVIFILIIIQAIYPTREKRLRNIVQTSNTDLIIKNDIDLEKKLPYTPAREADFDTWKNAYNLIILPARQLNKAPDEIRKELGEGGYPDSKRTYRKIIKAGDAGALQKFRQQKKRKVKTNSDTL